MTHFSMYFNCFIISLLPYIKINEKLLVCLSFAISVPISLLCFYMWFDKNLVITKRIKRLMITTNILYD